MSSVRPQRGAKSLIRSLHKGHEAEWKLVPAARSRSAQAEESARRGTRRGTIKNMQQYHIASPTFTWYALGISGGKKYLIETVDHSSALFSTRCTRAGPCLFASKLVGRLIGRVDFVVVVL